MYQCTGALEAFLLTQSTWKSPSLIGIPCEPFEYLLYEAQMMGLQFRVVATSAILKNRVQMSYVSRGASVQCV